MIQINFERNIQRNCVKKEFYFQSNFVKNSFNFPTAKSATQCTLLVLIDFCPV